MQMRMARQVGYIDTRTRTYIRNVLKTRLLWLRDGGDIVQDLSVHKASMLTAPWEKGRGATHSYTQPKERPSLKGPPLSLTTVQLESGGTGVGCTSHGVYVCVAGEGVNEERDQRGVAPRFSWRV